MAYLTVTTQADVVDPTDGKLSLREAVAQANASSAADSIRFVAALEGKTLVLTGGELVVIEDLKLDGDSNDDGIQVAIDGNLDDRIFSILGRDTHVELNDLTITNGRAGSYQNGGAILLDGARLALTGMTIAASGTDDYGDGGSIFARYESHLIVDDSRIINNYSRYGSSGIVAVGKSQIDIIRSEISGNYSYSRSSAVSVSDNSTLTIESSVISSNRCYDGDGTIFIKGSFASILRTSIVGNHAGSYGGGIFISGSSVVISDSTIANNDISVLGGDGRGAGISSFNKSSLFIDNSTITDNRNYGYDISIGGGIYAHPSTTVGLSNSIVAGNAAKSQYGSSADPDISGTITLSNGHNIFGSAVAGGIAGDRQNVSPAVVFAAIDPTTGGGQLSPKGIVPLKNAISNPALSAADPITASGFGQLGSTPRPQPAGSLPDVGSIEIKQALSTSPTINNDVLTGSAAANNLAGLAGNDLIQGLGGADTLNGNDGSDVLDGGPGNDKLNGGTGMDIATFAGSTAAIVDLAATPATAKRGGETDTLTSIEGAIGSSKADTFKGDAQNNEFQGGPGKDTATGGGGRDLYAFKSVADSPAGAGRDVIKDFVPGQDVIDVSNIDADSTVPGQQSFRWVGKATLTGAAQLGYYVSGGNTIVRASTDADAAAELEIQLTGQKALTAADFRP